MQKLKKLLKAASERQAEEGKPAAAADGREGASPPKDQSQPPQKQGSPLQMTPEEKEFQALLQQDFQRINAYFMEREEESVIRLQALSDRRAAAEAAGSSLRPREAEALRTAFVDFHGELVLLLHWSLVNYAGVVKILKKHDKLLGGQTQRAYLANVLHQPFTSTESISRLVRDTETHVRALSARAEGGAGRGGGGAAAGADERGAAIVK